MKIILLGYMGSGKSSVGVMLSRKLNLPFYDLDEVIIDNAGKSINEIFASEGAIAFRKMEHDALLSLLDTNEKMVLALGGGTPLYYDHMRLLSKKDNVQTIYLKSSIASLAERLKDEREYRPLIASLTKDKLSEFIAKHLFERSPVYEQADLTIVTDDKNIQTITENIVAQLF